MNVECKIHMFACVDIKTMVDNISVTICESFVSMRFIAKNMV